MSSAAPPLARYRQKYPHPAITFGRRRTLDYKLIDKQKWHARFEIVENLLKRRLVDLATRHHAEKSRPGFPTLHIQLCGQYASAEFRDRIRNALKQSRARNRNRLSFEEGRSRRRGNVSGSSPACCRPAALKLLQHCRDGRHILTLGKNVRNRGYSHEHKRCHQTRINRHRKQWRPLRLIFPTD